MTPPPPAAPPPAADPEKSTGVTVGPPPATLRCAVWLLLAEAAALAGVAVFLGYQDLTARATNLAVALGVTGFAVAGVLVLVLVARSLARRRPAGRGLAIVLQLMLAATAYYMVQGDLAAVGVPLIALALLVCGLLVSPPTTRALGL